MIFPWSIFQFTDPEMLHACGRTLWVWNRYLHGCVRESQAFQDTLVEYISFLEDQLYQKPVDKSKLH